MECFGINVPMKGMHRVVSMTEGVRTNMSKKTVRPLPNVIEDTICSHKLQEKMGEEGYTYPLANLRSQ